MAKLSIFFHIFVFTNQHFMFNEMKSHGVYVGFELLYPLLAGTPKMHPSQSRVVGMGRGVFLTSPQLSVGPGSVIPTLKAKV